MELREMKKWGYGIGIGFAAFSSPSLGPDRGLIRLSEGLERKWSPEHGRQEFDVP